jgi:hypothetical protein
VRDVCLPPSVTFAQQRRLDELANLLRKEIEKARCKSIVVADFVDKEGAPSSHGQYLAGRHSQLLEKHKKHFVVLERDLLSEALRQAQLAPRDLTVLDSRQWIGNSLSAAFFEFGEDQLGDFFQRFEHAHTLNRDAFQHWFALAPELFC